MVQIGYAMLSCFICLYCLLELFGLFVLFQWLFWILDLFQLFEWSVSFWLFALVFGRHWTVLIVCIASWIGLDCSQRFDCGFVWNAGQSWFVCITSWICLDCLYCFSGYVDSWICVGCLNGRNHFDCSHWFLEDLGQSWLFVLLLVLGWTACSVSIMDLFGMLDSLGCVNYFLDWVGLFWLFELVVRCVGSPVCLIVSWICLGRLGCVRCPDCFLLDYLYWLS